jgi:uncharacterized protein (DUF2147 family)
MAMPTTLVLALVATGSDPATAVVGDYWTEARDAIARVYADGDRFFGQLVWTEEADARDHENPDPGLRERPLRGLVFLRGFRFDGGSKWVDGTVYAPDDGKTYSGFMKMDGPDTLKLRGYVGISLFGRTATWPRVAPDEYPDGLATPAR